MLYDFPRQEEGAFSTQSTGVEFLKDFNLVKVVYTVQES